MTFSSVSFIFFFLPVSLLIYYLLPNKCKNVFLVIDSIMFYAYSAQEMVWLLLLCIGVNYVLALLIEYGKENKKKVVRKIGLYSALFFDIGILFFYKYLPALVESVNSLFATNAEIGDWLLPLGISFFTFRELSYILDVEFETCHAQKNVLNVALYLAFFPQVTMGPISKYCNFEKQIEPWNRGMNLDNFSEGIKRFVIGLCWKLILSNSVAMVVDASYGMASADRPVALAWLGAIAYLLQLYFDFAGYSEMAIGIGLMLGFECEENFMHPYGALKIGEYWRLWHATLGSWLKDYLYTPVFRSVFGKKNPFNGEKWTVLQGDIIALIATWVICGVWHGAGIKFLVYGLYYCCFIVGERLYQEHKKKKYKKLKQPVPKNTKMQNFMVHIYTLTVVLFGQVMFRSASLQDTFLYWGSMFGVTSGTVINTTAIYWLRQTLVPLVLGVICCLPWRKYYMAVLEKQENKYIRNLMQICSYVVYMLFFVIGISFVMISTNESFIYFQF